MRGTLLQIHPFSYVFSVGPVLMDSEEFFSCLVPDFDYVQVIYHDNTEFKCLPHPTPPFTLDIKLVHSGHNAVWCSMVQSDRSPLCVSNQGKGLQRISNAYQPHNTCCQNLAYVETRSFLYNLFPMVNVCMLSLACMIAVLASVFIPIKEIKKEQKNH